MSLADLPIPFSGAALRTLANAAALELRAARRFATVAALLADTTMAYGAGSRSVAAGDAVEAGGHRYEVAASGASDSHVATAGGVLLYVLAGAGGYDLRAFGAVGEGEDCTTAIDAAFAALAAADTIRITHTYVREILTTGTAAALIVPPGHYVYAGTGVRSIAEAGRNLAIIGQDAANTVIEITSDAYLIDYPDTATPNSIFVEGITTVGGKGLYLNRATVAVPQGYQTFNRVRVLGFSEVGIGSMWGDSPRWAVTNCILETTQPGTKGLLLPPGVANPDLSNTTIIGCTYRVVCSDSHQSMGFISGLTMFSLSTDDHEADIWLQPHATTTNAGQGVIITGNRFSNENREGKPVVLIAEADGVGDYWTQGHVTTASARYFRDWQFVGNVVTGSGTADETDTALTGPMIRSYAGDLGAFRIADNSINVGFRHLLYLHAAPTAGYASRAVIGPNDVQGAGEPPLPCNLQVGRWLDRAAEIGSLATPFPGGAGHDPNYFLLSAVAGNPAEVGDLTLAGGATLAASATDALGGSNAGEYDFTATTDYIGVPLTNLTSFTAGGTLFVEVDVQAPASASVGEVDLEVILTGAASSQTIRRGVLLTDDWLTVRLPVAANEALTGMSVRVYPSPDTFVAGVSDRVRIGRPRVYRANRPVNFDHDFIAGHAWNAGHSVRKGPGVSQHLSQWTDWTNSRLMAKFGIPASETDGSLIPLMATAGAGVDFTPTVEGSTSAGTGTYTANQGRYFQLGKFVIGFARVDWTAHTGTGNLLIALGALSATRNNATSRGVFLPLNVSGVTTTAGTVLAGYITHNTNKIAVMQRGNTGDAALALPTSGTIYFAFAYEAA